MAEQELSAAEKTPIQILDCFPFLRGRRRSKDFRNSLGFVSFRDRQKNRLDIRIEIQSPPGFGETQYQSWEKLGFPVDAGRNAADRLSTIRQRFGFWN